MDAEPEFTYAHLAAAEFDPSAAVAIAVVATTHDLYRMFRDNMSLTPNNHPAMVEYSHATPSAR